MEYEQVEKILATIELAPWYRNVAWQTEPMDLNPDFFPIARFRIVYDEPDTDTGEMSTQYARWWYVEESFTDEAVIKSAWLALIVSDEHRRREGFRVGGALIFSPHQPLNIPVTER